MRTDEVPQDKTSTYAGHKKLIYARDANGEFTGVQSSGWEPEAVATLDAVSLYRQLAREAFDEVRAGQYSPLYFHMYDCRMDLTLLCQLTGLWRWRVRRHLRPGPFARLSDKLLARYADAMDKPIETIKTLPDQPQ